MDVQERHSDSYDHIPKMVILSLLFLLSQTPLFFYLNTIGPPTFFFPIFFSLLTLISLSFNPPYHFITLDPSLSLPSLYRHIHINTSKKDVVTTLFQLRFQRRKCSPVHQIDHNRIYGHRHWCRTHLQRHDHACPRKIRSLFLPRRLVRDRLPCHV